MGPFDGTVVRALCCKLSGCWFKSYSVLCFPKGVISWSCVPDVASAKVKQTNQPTLFIIYKYYHFFIFYLFNY